MKRKLYSAVLAAVLLMTQSFTTLAAEDTYISEEIQEACIDAGEEYGICPELLMAIIEKESSGRPKAENADCKGLMQKNANIHKDRMDRLGVTDIFDIEGNVMVGTDYLSELFRENGSDIYIVLMKYNMNHTTAEKLFYEHKYSDYATSIAGRAAEIEEAADLE